MDINNPCQLKIRLQQRGVTTNDTPTYNQHGTMVMWEITYIDDGKPWFVGKDVAEMLEYDNPHKAILEHVDEKKIVSS